MKHTLPPYLKATRPLPEPYVAKRITSFLLLCAILVGFWVWNSVVVPERESKARSEEIKAEVDRTLALPWTHPADQPINF